MKVDGYNVKIDEFKRIKENTVALARLRYKDNFDTYAKNIDFDERTLDNIIQYATLLQEADKRGIYVSKADVDRGIREFPQWAPVEVESRVMPYGYYSMSKGRDGAFNPNMYRYFLAVYGKISPEDFSKEIENCLRITRLKEMLDESVLVTALEIDQEYRKQNEKAKIKSMDLQYNDFANKVKVDEAELNAFFEENILDYKVGDKVNISFIKLVPKSFEDNIRITDSEVANYYKNHKEEDYTEKEQVKARHILVELDASASTADKAEAKAHAEKILVEARKADADFAALAEKFNIEPLKVKHEELGFFERNRMVKPFEDAAFALSPGEISDIVETSYGYHVIKLEAKQAERIKPLEQVKGEIVAKLKEEQAVVEARQKAEDIKYTIMSEEDLQAAVDANPELDLKIQETGLFGKNEQIPNIGSPYRYGVVTEEAFKLKVDEISDRVEVTSYGGHVEGHFIFKLLAKEAGGLPKLDDVRDKVARDFKNEKALKMTMDEAKKIMAERDPADDLDKLAEKNKLKISESDPFALSTSGYISSKPVSVNSKAIIPKAFNMDVGEIAGPFEGKDGVYIIQLVERDKSDVTKLTEDEKAKGTMRAQILRQKRQKTYDAWYQKVKDKAVVTSFISTAS